MRWKMRGRVRRKRIMKTSKHKVSIPKHKVSISKHTVSISKHTVSISKHTVSVSKHTVSISKHTVSISKHTVSIPKHTVPISKHTESISKHTVSLGSKMEKERGSQVQPTPASRHTSKLSKLNRFRTPGGPPSRSLGRRAFEWHTIFTVFIIKSSCGAISGLSPT